MGHPAPALPSSGVCWGGPPGSHQQPSPTVPCRAPTGATRAPPWASPSVQPSPLVKHGETALPIDTPTSLLNWPTDKDRECRCLISLRNEPGKNVRVATSWNNDLICEVHSMHTSYFLRHIETEGTFSEKLCLDHVNQVKEPRKVSYHQRLKLISPTALNFPHYFFFGIFQEKIFRKHRTQKSHLAVYD